MANPWAQCSQSGHVSDAAGDCSFIVPNTQTGGTNNGRRFWVFHDGQSSSSPSGWFAVNTLRTAALDGGSAGATPYRFRTPAMVPGSTFTSGSGGFMGDASGNNATDSSGLWQQSRNNPSVPVKCGLKVALVLDLSGSIDSGEFTQLKDAANAFVTALTGTPSAVAVYTFASSAPATGNTTLPLTSVVSADEAGPVHTKINKLVKPGNPNYYTNWDRGLLQVAQSAETYDSVLFVTDGNPTVFGEASAVSTRFLEIEHGIFSANAVKTKGSKVIGVGVGLGTGSAAAANLQAVTGPDEDDDYFRVDNFAELGSNLRELALAGCTATVTVVKREIPQDGGIGDSVPAGGWTFHSSAAAPTTITPAQATTPGAGAPVGTPIGAVNFSVGLSGADSAAVTFTEDPRDGFSLFPVSGRNAVCTRLDGLSPPPNVRNVASGFTVDALRVSGLTCTVYNQPHPTVTLVKSWVNGASGDRSALTVAGGSGATSTSTASGANGTQTDTAHAATATVAPGTAVRVTEVLNADNLGGYTSALSCTNGITPNGSGQFTMPATSVTCTFTNTRTSANLILQKSWVNSLSGDTAVLSVTGSTNGSATSTAPAAPATGNRVSVAVRSGETVTLAEAFGAGNRGAYSRNLVCTQPGLSYTADALTGTYAMPATPVAVTCTFTNTLRVAALSIDKTVVNVGGYSPLPTFTVDVTCRIGGTTVASASDLAIQPGTPAVVSNVPVGAVCTVTEDALTDPPGWAWSDPVFDPANEGSTAGEVTLTVGGPNGVSVTNEILELPRPSIDLVKSVTSGSGFDSVGDVITYSLVATNTGNVPLTNVSISDPKLGALTCNPVQPVTLAPFATLTCTGTYTVVQADMNAGQVGNTATATGTPPTGGNVTDTDDATVPGVQATGIDLAKKATQVSFDAADDVIDYTLVATNTGTVTLTDVTIRDSRLADLACTPAQPATLAPQATLSCTGSYTVVQADLEAGSVQNTATVMGSPPTGPDVTDESTLIVPGVQTPGIDLVKTVTAGSGFDSVGDEITYGLVARNSGNVTLTDVSISDPRLGDLACTPAQPATLAPQATLSCIGSYIVVQADLEAGSVPNTAMVTGKPPSGPDVTDESSVTVPGVQTPGIDLVKLATSDSGFDAVGDVIEYSLVARNIGTVTLTGVTITDPRLGDLTCTPTQPTTLVPQATLSCIGSYEVTQADLDAGEVLNTASVTGAPPTGGPATDTDEEDVQGAQNPLIDLEKSVTTGAGFDSVGDVITYSLVATNTGNLTLTEVSISDPKLGDLSCDPLQPATLAPEATLTCTGSYTVVQADLEAGSVPNTATVTGTPPSGDDVTDESTVSVPGDQNPLIEVVKSVTSGAGFDLVGDVITYSLVATNRGNVTLTDVSISDAKLGDLTCTPTQPVTLVPQATLSCTGSYEVTQADLDGGLVENVASVSGTPPSGPDVVDTDDETVPGAANPGIELVKTATQDSFDSAGDVIEYTLVATNTGNVTLTEVSISDSRLGDLECTPAQPATLAPQATLSCTGSYSVVQADLEAGSALNTATVTGTPPTGQDVTDDSTVTVPGDQNPLVELVKSAAEAEYDAVGDVIPYTLTARNAGNVTLTGVTITDARLGALTCEPAQPATLAPDDELVCSGTYTVDQGDLDAGNVENTGSVTGNPPTGDPVTGTDSETVPGVQDPGIELVKTAAEADFDAVGDVLHYTLTATNTGDVTLTGVTITDARLGGLTCVPAQPATLAPGAALECSGSYTVVQDDLDEGEVVNNASVTGTPPTGDPVTDTDDATVPGLQDPGIELVKTVGQASFDAAGDVLTYTLTATNTGDVTLTGVTITDARLGALTCVPAQPATLAPGAALACSGSYTVLQGDVDAGSVLNTGSVTGNPPTGDPVTGTDSETVPGVQDPGIELVKTAAEADFDAVGDVLHYTLTATNTGDVTLTEVTITDAKLGALTCAPTQPATLAPDDELVCNGTYTVVQGDLDVGNVANTASVTATPPTGDPVTDTAEADVPADPNPEIGLVKVATESSFDAVGDVLHYTLTATNTGNVTLSGVTITDDRAATLTCVPTQPATLAPRAALECSGSYTVVQDDLDEGEVVNNASVTGTPPTGDPVTDADEATVPGLQDPDIELVKTVAQETFSQVGDVLDYELVATNTGDVTLTDVLITDDVAEPLACTPAQPATLAPGAVLTCTGTYTVVAADLTDKQVVNTANVTGTPPSGPPVTDTGTATVYMTATFTVVKVATSFPNLPDHETPDFPFQWSFGTGGTAPDFTLKGWQREVDDSPPATTRTTQADISMGVDGGDVWVEEMVGSTYMPQYWELVTDPDSGDRLRCTDAAGAEVPLVEAQNAARTTVHLNRGDDVTCVFSNRFDAQVGIVLEKTVTPTVVIEGNQASYTIKLTNSGNVPISLRDRAFLDAISDDKCSDLTFDQAESEKPENDRDGDLRTLAPAVPAVGGNPAQTADSWFFRCVGANLQAPSDGSGAIVNTATGGVPNPLAADPDDPANDLTDDASAEVQVLVPKIALTKAVDKAIINPGDQVTFTYHATNVGEVPLAVDPDTRLVDDRCSPVTYVSGDDGDELLEAGEDWLFTCTQILHEATRNTATVTGIPTLHDEESGTTQTAAEVSATAVAQVELAGGGAAAGASGIRMEKSASSNSVDPGDEVTFTYEVSNNGDGPLTNIDVTDDKCSPVEFESGDDDGDSMLDVGETWEYTCTHTLSRTTTNEGTATGEDESGRSVTDSDKVTVTVTGTSEGGGDGGGEDLPDTGAPGWIRTALLLSVLALAAGSALVVARRRRMS